EAGVEQDDPVVLAEACQQVLHEAPDALSPEELRAVELGGDIGAVEGQAGGTRPLLPRGRVSERCIVELPQEKLAAESLQPGGPEQAVERCRIEGPVADEAEVLGDTRHQLPLWRRRREGLLALVGGFDGLAERLEGARVEIIEQLDIA